MGAYFPFAEYDILQPMTGPGHATILSGTYPYLGGIPVNEWFNGKNQVYCVADSEFETVGPAKPWPQSGTSPRNFLGTTVGDELKNAGLPSKVVSVALKDRAAILMGGHRADLALWMDTGSFRWVSSSFYLPNRKLPPWVESLNGKLQTRSGQHYLWTLPSLPETTQAIFNVNRSGPDIKAIGDSFPHPVIRGTESELGSPGGLDLTVEAAEAAFEATHLAQGKGTDLLAISFSSHDIVGHAFGPNSRENEEMVVAEDRAIARLLGFIAKKVPGGLKNVVVALTADHGVAPVAEWLAAHRMDAGVVHERELNPRLEEKLEKKFGKIEGAPWLAFSVDFNYWINRSALEKAKANLEEVSNELKRILLEEKYFAYAFTGMDVDNHHLPPGMHERRILKTYFPGRSGDVIAIPRPFYYVGESTANHMADYSYDETVPLVLAGPGIRRGKFATRAEVVDLAPTLTYLLGIVRPSLSEGRVLSEALDLPGASQRGSNVVH
jgi:hypothetical protein